MKKTVSLFVFLLVCLKLSAAMQAADTNKMIGPPDASKDSARFQGLTYNLKTLSLKDFSIATYSNKFSLPAVSHYPDNLNVMMPVHHEADFSVSAIAYPDSLNLGAPENSSGSLSMSDSHLAENLNNKTRIKDADSLRLLAVMVRRDSIKFASYRAHKDSVEHYLSAMTLDSLKLQLRSPASAIFKGQIYSEIAGRYLDYDTISNRTVRLNFQNKVLNYTMQALHQYSYFNDTTGLRISFDRLAKVYMAQKKFSQAKWFILQSNSLSRAKRDPANIVSSLVTLSKIKSELDDYTLAMGDLNEALKISVDNHYPKLELEVLKNYALLYSRLKNYPKEEAVLKKRDSLEERIRKDEEAKLTAVLVAKDSIEKKKTDSVQVKKKVFSSNIRKLYKSGSARKVATL